MTYKESITAAMQTLAQDPKVCFVGYGVRYGGQGGGTFKGINPDQLIETPVAENLMMGMAIGLALAGRRPVVYFERFDFVLNAMDAIVNHLDKIETISNGKFAPAVIMRVVVGNSTKPLYTGPTHTQDFTDAINEMVQFNALRLTDSGDIDDSYCAAHEVMNLGKSTMLVEMKDLL